uniref:Glycosyl transferase family 1 domain-containing protein n=1 Tax=Globodera rostochiensis TaxID=31243 RepID=A0A914H6A0_GLORO
MTSLPAVLLLLLVGCHGTNLAPVEEKDAQNSPLLPIKTFSSRSPVSESEDLSPQTSIKKSGFAGMIKPLRIAIIAPLHQSVPPKPGKYSDKIKELILPKHELDKVAERTAQIVNELVEGLIARGHQVTLFASPDSNTSAHLISDASYGAFRGKRVMPGIFNHAYRWMFEQVRRRADKFDVLHFHTFEHLPHIDDFMGKTVTTLYDQPAGGTVADLNPLAELFPNAPIVVRRDLGKEVSKHWKNVIGTVNEEAENGTGLTSQYEKIYEKLLADQFKADNVQQKVQKANKQALCAKSIAGKMKILMVSSPIFDALPPKKAGGTEKMIYVLTESMVKLGHDVTLLATVGTETSAKLFEIPFKTNPWACQDNWALCQLPVIYSQEMVRRHAHEYDILQFHCPSYFIEFRHFIEHAVCTQHMPIDDTVLFKQFSHIPSISISVEQQKLTPIVLDLNWVGSVHNGINLDEFKFNETPKSGGDQYLAWMGRMVPDKGVDVAIKFAIESNMKLKIAAQIVDDRKKCLLSPEQRNEFLGNATAFLFTPKWDEPFGLGMIEAMATGTPVIAIQRGAVGEIVNEQNGVTFDYEENQMIFDFIESKKLIEKVSTLNRAKIRQTVEDRWSLEQMSKNYVKVYRNEMAKSHAHEYDILHFHDTTSFIEFRHFINLTVHTGTLPVDDTVFFKLFSHIPHISIAEFQT